MHKQGISITSGKETWDQGRKKRRSCGKVICLTENKRDTGKVNELMSIDLMAFLEHHVLPGAEEQRLNRRLRTFSGPFRMTFFPWQLTSEGSEEV